MNTFMQESILTNFDVVVEKHKFEFLELKSISIEKLERFPNPTGKEMIFRLFLL